MLFLKCGCLVAHGKYILWKCFSVWPCVGCKIIYVFILPSNLIFQKIERKRGKVRVRSRSHAKRERERRESPSPATTSLRLRWRPRAFAPWNHEPMNQSSTSLANPEPRSPTNPEPSTQSQSLRPTDLRPRAFDPRAFDFAGDLEPSTSPKTHEPISLYAILISVWFWFFLLLWWCGWWCFGGFCSGGFCVGGGKK